MKLLIVSFLLLSMGVMAQKNIVVLGSSTASGYGVNPDSSWVNRMAAYYGNKAKVTNLAVYGLDPYNALDPNAARPAGRPASDPVDNITNGMSYHPDYVFVNFPSNNYDIYSVAEIMSCHRAIYKQATANGHTFCYILTTEPRSQYNDAQRAKLKVIHDSIQLEFGTHAVEFFLPVSDQFLGILAYLSQGDGVHFNEWGHRIFWQQILGCGIIPVNLPLTMTYFKGQKDGNQINFAWQTAQEQNTDRFVLQSDDGGWHDIATVKAAGNSNSATNYTYSWGISLYYFSSLSFLLLLGAPRKRWYFALIGLTLFIAINACKKHNDPPQVTYKSANYRLMELDLDGTIQYSPTIRI